MTSVLRTASKAVFSALDIVAPPLRGRRILIYHQIGGGSGLEMEVSPEAFRRHVSWVAEHYPVVPIHDDTTRDSVVFTFDDGYRSVFDIAFPILRDHGFPFTLYLTTAPIESGVPLRSHPGAEPLTWAQVGEMLDSGLVTVGAHTHTHPDLRHVDEPTIERELVVSNELIEKRTGVQPEDFAYPWGYWSEQADAIVRREYKRAVLGSPRPFTRSEDPHLLHRLPVQLADGTVWFSRRVRKGLLVEEVVRRRLRGYSGP